MKKQALALAALFVAVFLVVVVALAFGDKFPEDSPGGGNIEDTEFVRGYREGYHDFTENPYSSNQKPSGSGTYNEGFNEGRDSAIADMGDLAFEK